MEKVNSNSSKGQSLNVLLADEINKHLQKPNLHFLRQCRKKKLVAGKIITYKGHFCFGDSAIEQRYYPLPEAQLDRFMFLIRLDYPNRDDELYQKDDYWRTTDIASTDRQESKRVPTTY